MASEAAVVGIYPRGFDSELDWPWPLVKASTVVQLNYGKALREPDRAPGEVPVYGTNGRCGSHNQALALGPGVILGRKGQGPLGVEWTDSDYWVIDTAYYATPINDQIDLRYFYYLSKYIGLNHLKDGTSNPSLSRDTFGDLLLPLPPVNIQRIIAKVLHTLDDKIELNRKMNETLEAMARAMFKSWFVDFDPVRDKAEGRDPGLPAPIAALFPDSFDEAADHEMPSGWITCGLDQIARFLNGLALQKYPPKDGQALPVIKIAQLRTEETSGADQASADLADDYIVNDGDVLFSWSGSLACVLWAGGRGALNQHLFKVTSTKYPKWFYWLWILHYLEEFQAIAADKATTMGHIQRRHLSEARVLLPPEPLLLEMDKHFRPLVDQIVLLKIESKMLATYRDSLLPKLIAGEIRLLGENEE
jgi:type I restriction enzyme S subunit